MLSAEGGCGCFHGSVCLSSVWSTVRSLADYRVDPLIVLIQFLLTDEWMEQRQQSSRASCCPLTFGLLLWSVVALRLSLKFIACCAVAPELIWAQWHRKILNTKIWWFHWQWTPFWFLSTQHRQFIVARCAVPASRQNRVPPDDITQVVRKVSQNQNHLRKYHSKLYYTIIIIQFS